MLLNDSPVRRYTDKRSNKLKVPVRAIRMPIPGPLGPLGDLFWDNLRWDRLGRRCWPMALQSASGDGCGGRAIGAPWGDHGQGALARQTRPERRKGGNECGIALEWRFCSGSSSP